MKQFDFGAFLLQSFEQGNTLHMDQVHRQKKKMLTDKKVPYDETDVPNIVLVKLSNRSIYLQLLTAQEDPTGTLVKTREHSGAVWEDSDINFFISQYLSDQRAPQASVADWFNSMSIAFTEVAGLWLVQSPHNNVKLYVEKKTNDKGLLIVRYKLGGQEYTFTKDTFLSKYGQSNPTPRRRSQMAW